MTETEPLFSDGTDSAPAADWPDTGGNPLGENPDINPRTGKPYTMSAEERKSIGQRLAEARRRKAAERGAKPGSRNGISGKGTRPGKSAPPRKSTKATADTAEAKAYEGADKVASWLALGGALLSERDPVRGCIIVGQAQRLQPILCALADESIPVRNALANLARATGPATAWADAAVWAATTAGAVALTLPTRPSGPVGTVLTALGGSVLDSAIAQAAMAVSARPSSTGYAVDPDAIARAHADLARRYGRPVPNVAQSTNEN